MASPQVRNGRSSGTRVETWLLAIVVVALVGIGGAIAVRLISSQPTDTRASSYTPQVGHIGAGSPAPSEQASSEPSDSSSSVPAPVLSMTVRFPKSGPGTYTFAQTTGPVLGEAGPIRKFRVAVESNLADVVDITDVLAKINSTLGDSRSWVGAHAYRLQQVPPTSSYEFTIYLVTEKTSSALCAPLYTAGYTSCRQGARVVLNLDRWMTSVQYYINADVSLDTYRTYMINHEVGHALGHGHELCPGPGRLAPVMEQQTLGLHGCKPNPWPFVDGKRYDGPSGQY
jgi:Protein of unknown function (DUF3152)